ncbi:CRISPR-associated Cas1 family protein [Gloeomargarita lithophora Alchichica-D10]|uniref:CRISPR-associated endonuclease Cas1 n=1 Tax=Gloeomargarita lithophora Alchichica-D10 TaxID=1188229 RepID=A0A1J0A986_9CYAN|nr:CRISPR-associated endonuclease Cas1 [Gloeomargarita lithophora]APB32485.1 CRISPR-associated Cas1 family protein [Gloeomargarita lithophora Alchichica-D10]
MHTLYVSRQDCRLSLRGELLVVKHQATVIQEVQLPLLDTILLFGNPQVTTQAIHACLKRQIPLIYLSQNGYGYGRLAPINAKNRHVAEQQRQMTAEHKLSLAKAIISAKIKNSKVFLQRQLRRHNITDNTQCLTTLTNCLAKIKIATSTEQLMGFEGAAAASYFPALGHCFQNPDFQFTHRNHRPPKDPVNALLSFGYQILWNHLLALVENFGLDPYQGCFHQFHHGHAALISDLIEPFRAPIIDSLVLWLINSHSVNFNHDFIYERGGCFLNNTGRVKYLKYFRDRMQENLKNFTRWDYLLQTIRTYRHSVLNPLIPYQTYAIR